MKIYVIYLLMLISFFSCKTEKQSEQPGKYNILFIAVDDLRPELNNFGADHILSLGIDQLASQSLVFDRAYCNIPVCGASRASLLSGKRPGRNRFIGYNTWLNEDYPGVTSLPMVFKKNGYTTISNGKIYHHEKDDSTAWHEIWHPNNEDGSWRDYQTEENIQLEKEGSKRGKPFEMAEVHDTIYKDGKTAKKTIEDLKKLKEKGEPFFLAAGFLKPHLPFNAPKKYWDLYDSETISLPDNYIRPETTPKEAFHNFGELRSYYGIPEKGPVTDKMANKLIHGYYACVSYTDAQILKLLNALKELELEKNTIVVLWGDHGWNLGDHKMWCKHCNFESSLHVPLMIKVPGKTKGQRTNAIIEYVDIFPSLCDLAGFGKPAHLEGESFVPLISGGERNKDYAISKFHDGVTIVKDTYFYTEWLDKKDEVKARMLFDHANDPLELENLAEKPEYEEKVKELSHLLHENWGKDFFLAKGTPVGDN